MSTTGHDMKAKTTVGAVLAAAVLFLCTACAGGGAPAGRPVANLEWTYDGATGPEHWGSLTPDFVLCADGGQQSPIDLSGAVATELPAIGFHYDEVALKIQNNGYTIQVPYPAGSSISLSGETYDFVQFHFHAPSEHAVEGAGYPMELHLVHRAEDGSLAVVGVFIEERAFNAAYDAVLRHLPIHESAEPEIVADARVDASDLFPDDLSRFAYDGSLTTPPCAEGVAWNVLVEPVQLSEDQIARFTAIFEDNHRPVQPRNDRRILFSGR